MSKEPRGFNYANVMSSFAMLFALTALVTGSVSAAGKGKDNKSGGQLPPNSVGAKQIKPGAVQTSELAPKAIDETKMQDEAVKAAQLAKNAVLSDKLAQNAVTSGKVAADAIGTSELSASLPAAGVGDLGTFSPTTINQTQFFVYPFGSEKYDTAGMHSNSTNNTRITAPVDGIYMISGQTNWNAGPTSGIRGTTILKNGNAVWINYQNGAEINQPFSTAFELNAGDYIEINVSNQSNADTGVQVEANMLWIAPGP